MIQAKCIQKFRDKQNKIYGYRLIDLNNQTQDVTPENLKKAILNKKIHIINLKLTSDGRLIDTNEKQLQSKELGAKPLNKDSKQRIEGVIACANSIKVNKVENIEISGLAKAFTLIDWSLIDMGDSHEEIVEQVCIEAGISTDVWRINNQDEMFDISNKAYQILINTENRFLSYHIKKLLIEEYYYQRIKDYMYHENVNKLNDSEMYKAVYCIYKYFNDRDKKTAKQIKEKLLDDMKQNGISSIKVGYEVGHEYFRYLDSEIFGTLSNDVFTVGHAITTDEKKNFKELKPYSYICSKDYDKLSPRPEISISFAFKNGEAGKVICDILLGRRGYISKNCCCIVGYVKTSDSIELDINNKDNAKIIADYCNKADIKIQKLVEKHPSLIRILPLGEKFELK